MSEFVFSAKNHHSRSGGVPPDIDASTPNRYFGYYENEAREQFIFMYDYATRVGSLWVGDAEWERFDVTAGNAPKLSMGVNEKRWLQVCWDTAVTFLPKN